MCVCVCELNAQHEIYRNHLFPTCADCVALATDFDRKKISGFDPNKIKISLLIEIYWNFSMQSDELTSILYENFTNMFNPQLKSHVQPNLIWFSNLLFWNWNVSMGRYTGELFFTSSLFVCDFDIGNWLPIWHWTFAMGSTLINNVVVVNLLTLRRQQS